MLLGPLYSGYMTYAVGFRTSCDIIAILLIAYSIIFFIFTREYTKSDDKDTSKADIKSFEYHTENEFVIK